MNATIEVADSSGSSGSSRPGHLKTVMTALAAAVLACAVATTTTLYIDGRYGPIKAGQFSGTYSEQNLVPSRDDFSGRLVGSSEASARLLESLYNAGSHAVEVTAIDTDDVVTDVRWSELRTVPGGYISGISTPWREFPADLPAHTTIRLLITIRRPAYCHDSEFAVNGNDLYSGPHRVHWKSLLRSHVTTVDDQVRTIHLC